MLSFSATNLELGTMLQLSGISPLLSFRFPMPIAALIFISGDGNDHTLPSLQMMQWNSKMNMRLDAASGETHNPHEQDSLDHWMYELETIIAGYQ
jgi:hypothetical protein